MINSDTFYFAYNIACFLAAYFCFALLVRSIIKPGVGYNYTKSFSFSEGLVVTFSIFLAILVGFREFNVGTDTGNYYRTWLYDQDILGVQSDFVFYYIMAFVRELFGSYQVFLLVIASIFYAVNYKALKNYSKYFEVNIFFIFFIFISLFFSLSTSINIVRQGLSLSFLFLGLSFFMHKNRTATVLCSALAVGFHITAIIPVMFFLLIHKFKIIRTRYYIVLFFIGIFISYLNFSILNISSVFEAILSGADDRRISYLDPSDVGYDIGFRLDFVLFNFIFLMFFLWIRNKLRFNYAYEFLLKYYCLSSFLFFMTFQINFSDRFGLFSWFAIVPLLAPAFSQGFDKKVSILILLMVFSLYIYFFLVK